MNTIQTEDTSTIKNITPLPIGQENSRKRKQARNACVNCQKACKKCADERPCPRCIKVGTTDTCVDSIRKPRLTGVKRGPYKRAKNRKTESGLSVPPLSNGTYAMLTAGGTNTPIPYQPFGDFSDFNNAPQYLPYTILNNMNNLIHVSGHTNDTTNGSDNANNHQQGNEKSTTDTENGNLSILSQLCTAVLDNVPDNDNTSSGNTKDENKVNKDNDAEIVTKVTPPPTNNLNTTDDVSNELNSDSDSQYGTPKSSPGNDLNSENGNGNGT